MKSLLIVLLTMTSQAWAGLGDVSSSAQNDQKIIRARAIKDSIGKESCYSVKTIQGDSSGAKEFINLATDKIFLIRANGRRFLNVKDLLGTSNFAEFQNAQKNAKKKITSRNHKVISVESANLKIRLEHSGPVHHASLLQKDAVPSCVADIEALQ